MIMPINDFMFLYFLLQEAMAKDRLDRTTEPEINLKAYLADAYLHPIFQSFEEEELVEVRVDKQQVCTASPITSELSSPSPSQHVDHPTSRPQNVYRPTSPQHHVYHPTSPQHAYNPTYPSDYIFPPSSPSHYAYHYES